MWKYIRPGKGALRMGLMVTVVALLVWWTLWENGGQSESDEHQSEDEMVESPPLVMRKIHLEEFHGEGKSLDLWADQAELYREEEKIQIRDIRMRHHIQEEAKFREVELVGKEGLYDLERKIAVIQGDVHIRSMEGHTLDTELIRYCYGKELVEGPGRVHVEGPEGWTEGVGFRMNTRTDTVVVLAEVRTLVKPGAAREAGEIIP